jgi:hypothetical protein
VFRCTSEESERETPRKRQAMTSEGEGFRLYKKLYVEKVGTQLQGHLKSGTENARKREKGQGKELKAFSILG